MINCQARFSFIIKTCTLYFALLVCSFAARAQGINQLWGMTQLGGTEHLGSIISTTSSGNNLQLRHELKYYTAGSLPQYTQLTEYNGKFYGLTKDGGTSDMGMLYEWDPVADVFIRKYDFTTAVGNYPQGSLTLFNNKLYGTTWLGGANGLGIIFEYDPGTSVFTKKLDFNGTNGSYPMASFTEYDGKLYGMASQGGINGSGVIFEWDPVANIYIKKIDLSNSLGSIPNGNLLLSGGIFYGLTSSGGATFAGVIFEWNPTTNIYTKKIDLVNATGSLPLGSLTVAGGKFYGTTQNGGAAFAGVIFEWDPATNIYTKKIDLDNTIGSNPSGNLIYYAGNFYGLTSSGGINGNGVLFEWNPVSNVYSKKKDFTSADGIAPKGSLAMLANKFYGVAEQGGLTFSGTVFEWDPATNIFIKRRNFKDAVNGHTAIGNLSLHAGNVFGTTNFGGANNEGVVFEFNPSSGAYTKRHDFSGSSTGKYPDGQLAVYDGKLYGTTLLGGAANDGVLYEWDPISNIYTKKRDFITSQGRNPTGYLCLNAGRFYGMTREGGGGFGTIYEWDPLTNVYTKRADFSGTNGDFPNAGLTFYSGKFYGVTRHGGNNSAGVIFEWNPVSNIITKKIDMSGVNVGGFPSCNLAMHNNKFYGITENGGASGGGVIFEWDPATNIYTKKLDFSPLNGFFPRGSLLLSDGKFYGMTQNGGTYGKGVVFEWDPVTNVYTKKKDLNGTDGASPLFNDFILVPAPVAKGNLVSCETVPSITIDATNNNVWVPIVDNKGDIVAEINANNNNLGFVSTSLFTKNGDCREDGSKRLYLNRNITITPQVQPVSGNVSVRLYILRSELDTLRLAMNSLGQPSGVASINEVDVFKNDDACVVTGGVTALPLTATSGVYNSDYYLQVSIGSFSSFYFANKLLTNILPVKIRSFTGRISGVVNLLSWEVSCNSSVIFSVEKGSDPVHFETIGNISAGAADCSQVFSFTDNKPLPNKNYYRLKIIEPGGAISYSPVILLLRNETGDLEISMYSRMLSRASIDMRISSENSQPVELLITDVTGRIVLRQPVSIRSGSNDISVNAAALVPGIYWLYGVGKDGKSNVVRFVKQ